MGHDPDMARKLRLQYPGAIYHLMSRGDRREPVFLEDADRALFVSTLGEACAKTDWQVHGYGEERRESAQDKAARLVALGLKEAGWKPSDLALRRNGGPVKIALARRLRRETTMPVKWICERLAMGSWKSVNRRLYEHRNTKC